MKKSSPYVSGTLLLIAVFCFSCSPRLNQESATQPEIIVTDSLSQKFNLQLDFMKNHFSGLLIARRMAPDDIRLLFTTYFGLSIFDFSLRGDSLHVNSCVEPMRRKKVLKLLERDFKIVFLPSRKVRVKEKTAIFEKRTSGNGLGKAVISLSEYQYGEPARIQIKHPWIRLKIQLDKLNNQ